MEKPIVLAGAKIGSFNGRAFNQKRTLLVASRAVFFYKLLSCKASRFFGTLFC